MKAHRHSTLGWLVLLALGVACSNKNDGATTPCTPACNAGYTCELGVCMVQCNPACGETERCVVASGATMCVPADSDAAVAPDVTGDGPTGDAIPQGDVVTDAGGDVVTPVDALTADTPATTDVVDVVTPADSEPPRDAPTIDVVTPDVVAPADVVTPTDVVSPMDVVTPTDVVTPMDVVTPTDTATDRAVVDAPTSPDVADAGLTCGANAQDCCGGVGCAPGLECARDTCRAVTVVPDECVNTAVCHSGQVCGGPSFCGSRACFRCVAPRGARAFDAACTTSADCASGVCTDGRCAVACALGPDGDRQCGAVATGAHCISLLFGTPPVDDAGIPSSWVNLGVCVPGCNRASDCTSPRVCRPVVDFVLDRVVNACAAPRTGATNPVGATCTSESQCQAGLCIRVSGITAPATCSVVCTADTDCPAEAPVCGSFSLYTPDGRVQAARGCLPRR